MPQITVSSFKTKTHPLIYCWFYLLFLLQAEFDIQREVFEQRLFDSGLPSLELDAEVATGPGTATATATATATDGAENLPLSTAGSISGPVCASSGPEGTTPTASASSRRLRRAVPYRHELQFEDLVYPPVWI